MEWGHDGLFEIGYKQVDDPDVAEALLTVAVNVRHDVIEFLYSRIDPNTKRRMIDEAQRKAGNAFLALLERTHESRGLALDYTKVRVDGGCGVPEISLGRERAARELARIKAKLGLRDFYLARTIIGSNVPISATSPSAAERRYLSRRFRDVLTTLAVHWGYSTLGDGRNANSACLAS